MPEYTNSNEIRWAWNDISQITIYNNRNSQGYVLVKDIPLHHLKEFSGKFKHGYLKVPYLINGNQLQFYFDDTTKRIFIEGKVEDKRKKGYLNPLTISYEEWDEAIKEIEK